MTNGEKRRIDLLEKIKTDSNELPIGAVTEIFCGILGSYFEVTKTGSDIKRKLTEDEYISFVTGFANSFLSSLYVSGARNVTEFHQRKELVENTNKDVLTVEETKICA